MEKRLNIHTLINYRGYKERRKFEIQAPHKLSKQVGRKHINFCKSVFGHEFKMNTGFMIN